MINLIVLAVGILAVMALWVYGPLLAWKGFSSRPILTATVLAVLGLGAVIAALAAPRLFPHCGFERYYRVAPRHCSVP